MKTIYEVLDVMKKVIKIEMKDGDKPSFCPVFKFPFSIDYADWIEQKMKIIPASGPRWVKFYNEIIEREIDPEGVIFPEEWRTKIFRQISNGVYIIADENDNVLYIGKTEHTAIGRLIDRFIPKKSEDRYPRGQVENNVPLIWDDILSIGGHIKCCFSYDLSFSPELLEYYLLHEYMLKYGMRPIGNKMMPKSEFLPRVLEIRSLVNHL
jgi:hypothetical protein